MTERGIQPWVIAYLRWQTMTNTLASVAIEVPALRPVLERRIEAFDGPGGEAVSTLCHTSSDGNSAIQTRQTPRPVAKP